MLKHINWKFLILVILPIMIMYVVDIRSYSSGGAQTSRTPILLSTLIFALIFQEGRFRTQFISVIFLFVGYISLSAIITRGLSALEAYVPSMIIWPVLMYAIMNTKLKENDILVVGLLGAIAANLCAYFYFIIKSQMLFLLDGDEAVGAYNSIYYVLLLLPYIFIIKNKLLVFLLLLLPSFAIAISNKSTALFVLVAALLFYLLYSFGRTGIKSILVFSIIAIIIIISITFAIDVDESMDMISSDIDSGGNGRIDLAAKAINAFISSDLIEMICGHGQGSVVTLLGMGAHNDFIEVLYEYGIIGFILYIWMWFILFLKVFKMDKSLPLYPIYVINLVVFFACSLASKLLGTQIQMIPQTILIGIFWKYTLSKRN